MRLAAQAKGGFYPCPNEVMAAWAQCLRCEDPAGVAVLDPCAGKGEALFTLAGALGIPGGNVYAIELDDGRADDLRARFPDTPPSNLLAPGDGLQIGCNVRSFSLVWCNPPYDDEIGGGKRVEFAFLRQVSDWLVPGGVLGFAIPESQADGNWYIRQHLDQHYDKIVVCPYLDGLRRFREVIITGVKRKEMNLLPSNDELKHSTLDAQRAAYLIPAAPGPKRFHKTGPTPAELGRMLRASPLNALIEPPKLPPLASPPLPLNVGHTALLLASGYIDGIVEPPGEPPHVVRGTVRKEKYLAATEQTENASGSVTTKEVWKENIKLTVRAVGEDGEIRSFE